MSMIIIDPEGDLILEFGEERLLVSSKVLSLASPVFAAMLKPQFKEGVRSHLTSEEPSIIPLPEDDAKAFVLFCKVTHHRSDKIPQEPDISCLENLAFICDKYHCAGPIANCVILWLQKLFKAASPEDLNRLLLVAYVLDLPESFLTISGEILQLQAGAFINLPVLADHPLVRHELLAEFNARKLEVNQTFQKAIMRPISRITLGCDTTNKTIGQYIYNLKRCGISPYEKSFEQQSFFSVVGKASTFPKQRFEGCSGHYCGCRQVGPINLKKELRQEIEEFRNLKKGLCLDCVGTGRKSKVEGKCRVPHP